MPRPLANPCGACTKGVVHDPNGFGWPCPLCGGLGSLSDATLAGWLKESPKTLRRFRLGKLKNVETAGRISGKLAALWSAHKKPPKKKAPQPLPLPKGRRQRQGRLFA